MLIRRFAVAGMALVLAACATLNAESPLDEKVKVVTERANARWAAIIAKDFDAAYGYLSPASRTSIKRGGFKAVVSRLNYKSATVKQASCEGAVCRVDLELVYDANMMKGIKTPIRESWIIEKGQAWFVWPVL